MWWTVAEFIAAWDLITNQQMADTIAWTTGQTKKSDWLLQGILTKIDPVIQQKNSVNNILKALF